MAFDRSGLYFAGNSPLNGQRVWYYQTLDAGTAVDAAGYFNSAYRELELGDLIFYSTVTGSIRNPSGFTARGTLYVNSKSAGIIDTVDAVAHASTDSD
jgi:hypothetical protein